MRGVKIFIVTERKVLSGLAKVMVHELNDCNYVDVKVDNAHLHSFITVRVITKDFSVVVVAVVYFINTVLEDLNYVLFFLDVVSDFEKSEMGMLI